MISGMTASNTNPRTELCSRSTICRNSELKKKKDLNPSQEFKKPYFLFIHQCNKLDSTYIRDERISQDKDNIAYAERIAIRQTVGGQRSIETEKNREREIKKHRNEGTER